MFEEMIKAMMAQLSQSYGTAPQSGQEVPTAFKPMELVTRSEYQALQQKYIAQLENANSFLQENMAIQRNYLTCIIGQNNSIDGLKAMVIDKNRVIDQLTADLETTRLQNDTIRKGVS